MDPAWQKPVSRRDVPNLCGHVKGAFTGADKDRKGAFEEANGGTLFLDEVGECDLVMQAKLLRALQPPPGKGPCQSVFRCVGATKDKTVDVRIIAATNKDLSAAITAGEFREDLMYRLSIVTLKLPLGGGFELDSHLVDIQRHFLRRAMIEADGKVTKAAKLLGYQTLSAQLERLGVEFEKGTESK